MNPIFKTTQEISDQLVSIGAAGLAIGTLVLIAVMAYHAWLAVKA